MIDLAPGWQIRCPRCGRTKLLGEMKRFGLFRPIRIGAFSVGKRTLAWCSNCRAVRFAIVEAMPAISNHDAMGDSA